MRRVCQVLVAPAGQGRHHVRAQSTYSVLPPSRAPATPRRTPLTTPPQRATGPRRGALGASAPVARPDSIALCGSKERVGRTAPWRRAAARRRPPAGPARAGGVCGGRHRHAPLHTHTPVSAARWHFRLAPLCRWVANCRVPGVSDVPQSTRPQRFFSKSMGRAVGARPLSPPAASAARRPARVGTAGRPRSGRHRLLGRAPCKPPLLPLLKQSIHFTRAASCQYRQSPSFGPVLCPSAPPRRGPGRPDGGWCVTRCIAMPTLRAHKGSAAATTGDAARHDSGTPAGE
jgi:hypothetical protein